jgi:carbonyl reductase 1
MTSPLRVLVTGANKGIGRATVAAILERRDDAFVLLGSRSEARGREARDALVADHPAWAERVETLAIDVADDASVSAAADRVATRFGRDPGTLYGLVNNAGIGLGSADMRTVLNVNAYGPRRVVDAFVPLVDPNGRIVNVSSASGPMFVSACRDERKRTLTSPDVSWADIEALMNECLELAAAGGDFKSAGLGTGDAYGLSKACLNAYTIALARAHPSLTINACTPGYIATDLTLPRAQARNVDPASMGMKSPAEGTRATLHLLFGDPGGSGWFFGSDAVRSPLHRYRSPGDPPFTGS